MRFLVAPALVFATFGSKMSPWRVDFRCFSENRGFLEIELSMVIWPCFEGRTLPKLTPQRCENRLPCATAEKTEKNGRRDPLFRPRARFWSILGSRLGPRMVSLGRLSADLRRLSRLFGHLLGHTWFFFARGCSGRVPGSTWGVLWTLPGRILGRFSVILCVVPVIGGVLILL